VRASFVSRLRPVVCAAAKGGWDVRGWHAASWNFGRKPGRFAIRARGREPRAYKRGGVPFSCAYGCWPPRKGVANRFYIASLCGHGLIK